MTTPASPPADPAREPSRLRRLGRRLDRLSVAVPALVSLFVVPAYLRITLSVYDAGLALTLARFLGLDRLPYRDLWTLYGPGPPVLGSLIMGIFGPGLAPQRIVVVLVHLSIVLVSYLLSRRFVPRWVAAALATFVAVGAYPVHFQQTIVLLLWGVWFVLRASEDRERAPRRLLVASLLFGLSFWGRFEFVLVAIPLVVVLWVASRGRLDDRRRRTILWAGLGPPALFLLYVIAVVGDRAWLNLVDYPFFRYSDEACRGLPDVWAPALGAFLAPFRDHPWSTYELLLWTATFLPPVLGLGCALVAWFRRGGDRLQTFAIAAIGGLTLFLWLEHRPRASSSPDPLIPLMAVSGAILLGALARRRPIAARVASIVAAAVIVVTVAISTIPTSAWAWRDWPPYDPMIGWEGGQAEGLYDERVWSEVVSEVTARTDPGEEIFVALTDNRTHFANAPIFYWLTDRPPASRFIEFDPCLTDTAPIQREIVADLAGVDVVVATTFFPDLRRDPATGPTILDDELASEFEPVYEGSLPQDQAVVVLERRS